MQVPFRVLASMLKLDDDLDVNKRSQRLIDKNRATKVAKYIDKNKDGFYVIPPLVGFIEGDFTFEEVPLDGFSNVGLIHVDLSSRFVLFDGQHRAFGIREAMRLAPEISSENISIMFFVDLSLSQRKQAFHDINFTQKTPASALCVAYNERDDFDKMVVNVFSNSSIRHLIEYEKNTASGNNEKIYSLKSLKDFAVNFFGGKDEFNPHQLAEYVDELFNVINISNHLAMIELENKNLIKHGFVAAKSYRNHYIIPHAVTLKALGLLGRALIKEDAWQDKLQTLSNKKLFDKTSASWLGRCVTEQGKMISNQRAVRLTYYQLKNQCGLLLSKEEKGEEKELYDLL